MRSLLDPLPRSLSLRSLAVLVTMLVAGTAISVHEYLETERTPSVRSTGPATRSAPRTCRPEDRSMPVGVAAPRRLTDTRSSSAGEPQREEPKAAPEPAPAAPSAWVPGPEAPAAIDG